MRGAEVFRKHPSDSREYEYLRERLVFSSRVYGGLQVRMREAACMGEREERRELRVVTVC